MICHIHFAYLNIYENVITITIVKLYFLYFLCVSNIAPSHLFFSLSHNKAQNTLCFKKKTFIALMDSVGQAFRMGFMGSLFFFFFLPSLVPLLGNCQRGEGDCLITWGGIIRRRLHSHTWEWFWMLTETSLDCWLIHLHMASAGGPFTWLPQALFQSIIEHHFHCNLLAKNQL